MRDCDMPPIKQNKAKINATVSKWVKDKAEKYAESDEYGSFSNFIETAMTFYMGSLEKERELIERNNEELIKEKQKECQETTSLLIKLLTLHPELLQEIKETDEGHELLKSKKDNVKTINLNPYVKQRYIID